MPLLFRAPGIPLRIDELLMRVQPTRAARDLVRSGRLRWARTFGVGEPWQPGGPVRSLREEAPPAAAFWLDDVACAPRSPLDGTELELELPPLPWPSGHVPVRGGGRFAFDAEPPHGDRARVRFVCEGEGARRVLAWCAQAGAPALGDLAHGGSLAQAGEPLFAPPGALRISPAAARALARGHPWLTRDRESEDEGRFTFGAAVELRDAASGTPVGIARIEGGPHLVARRWSAPLMGAQRGERPPSVEERVARAVSRRARLLGGGTTDALRLAHGEADGLPGLFADRFGSLLRLIVAGRAALPIWERASVALCGALREHLAGGRDPSVVVVMQLRPQPPGELRCVQWTSGPAPPEPLIASEGDLRFRVRSGLDEPCRPHPGVGLFLDQRENRRRLAARVRPGGVYANLFAHTGAFSAALLRAGAGEVTSVDLSASYLRQLEENLALSGLPRERHRSVRRDVRRFLADLPPAARLDGIVLDPPTAASAGRSFWSARKGMEALAAECLRRLAPGGFLLASTNDRRARGRLAGHIEAAARDAGVAVRLSEAPPSTDFPALRGFPEGAAFEAILAERIG